MVDASDKILDSGDDTADEQDSKNDKLKQKPPRPCLYCPNYETQSNLKRHMKRKHQEKIQHILSYTPKKQTKEFKKLRLEGIFKYNQHNKAISKNFPLQRARRPLKNSILKMCSLCKIFVSKKTFYKHKCVNQSPLKSSKSVDPSPSLSLKKLNEDYLTECINRLQDDAIGNLIREDPDILYLGEKKYLNTSNAKEVQRKVRVNAYLRKLGLVYKYFLENVSTELKFIDMFSSKYIDTMKDAIFSCIKNGVTQGAMYYNAIRYSCERLCSKFFDEGDIKMSEYLKLFRNSLANMYRENFKNLAEEIIREKARKSKNDDNLIDQDQISILIRYCMDTLSCDRSIEYFGENYVKIRKSLVTLLTLDNSRRGI